MIVGLLGGGVIGGGWAARFLLNGHDVRLHDPDPEAPRRIDEMLENARHAYARLTYAPLPPEGTLAFAETPEEAVEGADFVQESAPERIEVKRDLLRRASLATDSVIASSTSGLLPSVLQEGMRDPDRFTVGHPFNPVYLLPLVEVCGAGHDGASQVYRAVGMHPLVVRREIDGFIADRLLEALWREALWLVNDDVATVEEIDDAIRFGPGLRWSAMGTFLLYRIAGGEAGVRHFMAHFGPALQWPWTKLVDVPELTDEFIDKIERQSDAQAAGMSVRELEQLRDDCLVDVLHALRGHGVGAGRTLAEHERRLLEVERDPLRWETRVLPDWVDYNGHATESSYLLMTSHAADGLLNTIGVDGDYLREVGSYYTVETHICHLAEAKAGDRIVATTQVLGADEKRIHIFVRIARDDTLLATVEQMLLHVSNGQAAPARIDVQARVRELVDGDVPERVGRRIAMPA